jgi:HrpA-like RNA helicase
MDSSPSISTAPPSASDNTLPIYSILDSIDFNDHFLIMGETGTGKSTVTPIHEFQITSGRKKGGGGIIIREPSRASCNALYYSLVSLYPELKGDLAVITKDTRINAELGRVKIVTDGVLLRMLAEDSVRSSSIYFDESHQMTSQLELCMSLARRGVDQSGNLLRVMSATIDPSEFTSFLGISKHYSITGRRYPVSIEVEQAEDLDGMFDKLSTYLYAQPQNESWLVFLPTRRLVERYSKSYGGTYIHGGLDGSEINKIQSRAEVDRTLKIFATNVIASSVNVYVDNVLIFNESIVSKERSGHKSLDYRAVDNNSLLQMIGRVGRFKKGRAVIITETPLPKKISPTPVRKSLEHETPFDLVLLMSRYALRLSELEFMSKLNESEVSFAEDWLYDVGAIDRGTHMTTEKGLIMTEIPFDPDYAHLIADAILRDDYDVARFLLAAARDFLYSLDRSSELNIKAQLLKKYSEDREGRFVSQLLTNGIFPRFVDEAWKDYEAALDSLNDVLSERGRKQVEREVLTRVPSSSIAPYLADSRSFEKYHEHERFDYDIADIEIAGDFYARSITMNYRKILFDVVALPSRRASTLEKKMRW